MPPSHFWKSFGRSTQDVNDSNQFRGLGWHENGFIGAIVCHYSPLTVHICIILTAAADREVAFTFISTTHSLHLWLVWYVDAAGHFAFTSPLSLTLSLSLSSPYNMPLKSLQFGAALHVPHTLSH